MPLGPGTRLGPYEIVAAIGAGGMGEVHRAIDTNLKRAVAIKVLPASVSNDPERLARFQREAEVLASLSHPHIAAIYGLEKSAGTTALVMELVEGEDLSQRIARGPIPLDEALPIAKQIAEALEAAHEQGIIHRDLKPANIKVTPSGTVKVLDFGLAKLSESQGATTPHPLSMSPTITSPALMTGVGVLLGTAAYMSPEQARGKAVDRRSDIWAFGCVIYEMVTGRRAFSGNEVSDVLASVLAREPDWTLMPRAMSPALGTFIRHCLQKDRKDRIGDAQTIRLALEGAFESQTAAVTPKSPRTRLVWAFASLAIVTLVGAIALVVAARRPSTSAAEVQQFAIFPPEKASFSADSNAQAVSPDGRQIVFVASGSDGLPQLWIRRLDSLNTRSLAGTDGAKQPFWSPDSRSVGFFAAGKLKTIRVEGGPPQTLADAPFPLGGTWNRDGVILFGGSLGSPIFRVSSGGGATTQATTLDQTKGIAAHTSPFFLPDGRHFFFVVSTGPTTGDAYVGSLDSNEVKPLLRSDSAAVYSPAGYVLFLRDSTLMAQRFDLATLSTRGEAVAVAEGVGKIFTMISVSVSDTGTLVYRPAVAGQTRLVWMSRTGEAQGIGAPAGDYQEMSLSPDDKRVAFARGGQTGADVWLTDLERRITSRFTFRPPVNNVPIWSADGRQIVFASVVDGRLDLYRRPSDASRPDELLLKLNAQPILFPSDWSADGRFLTYYRTDPKTQLDIWTLSMESNRPSIGSEHPDAAEGRKPVPFLHGDFNESQGQFSPDGRWIAYVSDESGSQQVYVQSFPTLGGQQQISREGGNQPRWRRDGRELFYLAPDRKLMAVTVKTGATFEADAPRTLFQTELNVTALRQSYAVSADGQRFLLNTSLEAGSPPMTVVLNWTALLKK